MINSSIKVLTKHHEVGLTGPGGQSIGIQSHIGAAQLGIDLHRQIGHVLRAASQLAGVADARLAADKALAGAAQEAVCCSLDLLQLGASRIEVLPTDFSAVYVYIYIS